MADHGPRVDPGRPAGVPARSLTANDLGIDAARANNIDLTPFKSILVVHNFGVDHGAAGNGVLIVHQNATLCEFGFICHEMGHGFGLPHSYAANPDMEYGDGWNVMSFATTTFQFPVTFKTASGAATVGLNARNLEALRAVPARRLWTPAQPDFSEVITLDPLNQPPLGNRGFLVGKIGPKLHDRLSARQQTARTSSSSGEKRAVDRSIPQDAVLMHEITSNGLSFLQPSAGGQFTAGQQFVTPDPKVFVRVEEHRPGSGNRHAPRLGYPGGEPSGRKARNRRSTSSRTAPAKWWVTSPQALAALGKTWQTSGWFRTADSNSTPPGADIPQSSCWLPKSSQLHGGVVVAT